MNSLLLLLANEKFTLSSLLDRPGYDEENLSRLKLFLALFTLVVLFYESTRDAEGNPVPPQRLVALTIDVIIHVVAQNQYDEDGRPIRKDRYVAEVPL